MALVNHCPHFTNHNDYYTPLKAWKQINHLIPKDKIIYEAFMLNSDLSKSPEYLENLGNKVIFDRTVDFLNDNERLKNWDIIVSNPPFEKSLKLPILNKLVELDKPFIIIMNSMNTFSKYMRTIFKDKIKDLQVITPQGKINFDKLEDGVLTPTKSCVFYSCYVVYKMNLSQNQLWLK